MCRHCAGGAGSIASTSSWYTPAALLEGSACAARCFCCLPRRCIGHLTQLKAVTSCDHCCGLQWTPEMTHWCGALDDCAPPPDSAAWGPLLEPALGAAPAAQFCRWGMLRSAAARSGCTRCRRGGLHSQAALSARPCRWVLRKRSGTLLHVWYSGEAAAACSRCMRTEAGAPWLGDASAVTSAVYCWLQ